MSYKKKEGFLLIELIISLAVLSFTLFLFSQFFCSIVSWHQEASDRLTLLLMAQNSIEKTWQTATSETLMYSDEQMSLKQMSLKMIRLPLPIIDARMPYSETRLVYNMLRCEKRDVIVELPGYIYEST